MSVVIFGNGPMTNEPDFAVMAPGSRTWQIVRTVANGLASVRAVTEKIVIFSLDDTPRKEDSPCSENSSIQAMGNSIDIEYHPLSFEQFRSLGTDNPMLHDLPGNIRAVVGTGSAQPYSTAAGFAKRRDLPLWIDVFGDPVCETQSQLEIMTGGDPVSADNQLVHVWKLMLDALMAGDQFYGLSRRQRHALQGQLGCVGRLNQYTAPTSICHYLPYAVFEEDTQLFDLPVSRSADQFTIMWCGSFNTWMDVPTLTHGIVNALKSNPNMRLLVVGGHIAGYNELSYGQFLEGIKAADVEGSVTLMNWQPLRAMQKLYAQCDLGISIDRYTYEAELGSRTRLINFLAAGVPIASTIITELSSDLRNDNMVLPFETGNADSLTQMLLTASSAGPVTEIQRKKCRQYILDHYNGLTWGEELRAWIAKPAKAADHQTTESTNDRTNDLVEYWQRVREPLGL